MGLTKQQLEALNNNSFPNNNAGAITPAILRDYNTSAIANTVNQDVYTADSASFSASIASLNNFSSSLDATFATDAQLNASSSTLQANINTKLDSASFNSYTQSTNTFTASISTSVGLLQTFSGSQYKGDSSSFDSRILAITASVPAGTVSSSAQIVAYNIFATTASVTASINTLSSSIYQTDATQSYQITANALTASNSTTALSQSLYFTDTTQSVNITQASASAWGAFQSASAYSASAYQVDVSQSQQIAAAFATASAYSASLAASITGSTENVNTLSASIYQTDSTQSNAITNNSSSFATSISASNFNITNNSASVATTINTLSSSIFQTDATQSNAITNNSSSIGLLQTFSGSQYKNDSSSFDSRIIAATGSAIYTGSFATTGSNTFIGNQTINGDISSSGNLIVNTITASAAQITYLHTIYESSSVIYSSGSNQLGDELSDTQILSGSVQVVGGLTLNGVSVSTQSVDISALNAFTASQIVSNSYFATTSSVDNLSASVYQTDSTQSNQISANSQSAATSFSASNATIVALSSSIYTTDSNQQNQINSLINATASYAISSSVKVVTDGLQNQINTLSTTASVNALSESIFQTDATQSINISNNSSSIGLLQTFSGSQYKNDSSSFDSRIIAATGSTINTGSFVTTSSFNSYTSSQDFKNTTFATTGSNTFIGTQTLLETGSWGGVLLNVQSGSIKFNGQVADTGWEGTGSIFLSPVNLPHGSTKVVFQTEYQSGSTSPNGWDYLLGIGRQGDTFSKTVDIGTDVTLDVSRGNVVGFPFATTASFNLFSGSQYKNDSASFDTRINSGAITGSSIITASVSQSTITFTKGDNTTFNIVVADVSGSTFDTGSFATTGSNTFVGNQTITGDITASGNISSSTISGIGNVTLFSSSVDSRLLAAGGQSQIQDEGTILGNVTSFNFNGAGVTASVSAGTASITIAGGGGSIYTGSFATTGSNTFIGNQIISGNVELSENSNLTVNNGGVTKLENTWVKALICTSSVTIKAGGLTSTGSIVTTGDVIALGITAVNDISTSANVSGLNILALQASSSTFATNTFTASQIVSNSYFATTGSNYFKGVESIGDTSNTSTGQGESYLLGYSGSLVLSNNSVTPTYSSLSHISSSNANTNSNLIFKSNTNTGTTVVSGSANIFVNAAAVTAGFKRYIGGSGNIMLNGSNVPQISSSMTFSPTMNNNYFGGNSTTLIMRGPVSSSAWTISGNSILGTVSIGSSDANHARGIQSGLTLTGNSVAGTLTVIANKENLSSSLSITNTNLNGAATINANSSSVAMANNNINDNAFTLNNNFFTDSAGVGQLSFNRCNIGGTTHTITIQGTLPAGTNNPPTLSDNTILGGNNTIFSDASSARVSGTNAYHSAIRNIIGGNQLIVSASSLLSDTTSFGSAYFGRWNVNDGIRNKTSDIVFAVGTGTSTTRKTGFLIDSGSNTFVEGTLNVSGSTSFTGSVSVASTFQLQLPSGSNQQTGLATLDGGNPGAVTISNSLVTANSIIMLTKQTNNHPNSGPVNVSSKGSGTFTITSNHNGDTDVVAFMIINPS